MQTRNAYRLAVLAACSVGLVFGQSFEVASIKPHPMPQGQFVFRMSNTPGPIIPHAKGNRFATDVVTVQDLIQVAYGVMDYQIVGLTDWEKVPGGEHFDIDARSAGEAEPSADQLKSMLQNLLADRFQLKVHKEKRELPVYALVIAKGGVKGRPLTEEEIKAGNMPATGAVRRADASATMRMEVDPGLVRLLANVVDRPILDQTGLKGRYEFASLDWRQLGIEHREDPVAGMASAFTAVKEQLGLQLEPRKEPMDVIVIDHAERPSAN